MPRSKDFLNEVVRAGYIPSTLENCRFDDPDIEKFYEITIIEEKHGEKYKRYFPRGKKGWQPLTITQETPEGEKIVYSRITYVGMESLLEKYGNFSPVPDRSGEDYGDLKFMDYAPDHP